MMKGLESMISEERLKDFGMEKTEGRFDSLQVLNDFYKGSFYNMFLMSCGDRSRSNRLKLQQGILKH